MQCFARGATCFQTNFSDPGGGGPACISWQPAVAAQSIVSLIFRKFVRILVHRLCIFATEPNQILGFKGFDGTPNSHFRCGDQADSIFQALRWLSEFTFSLREPIEFYASNALLAPQIRIVAAEPKRFLRFQRLAGTLNSHFAEEAKQILRSKRSADTHDSHSRCGI